MDYLNAGLDAVQSQLAWVATEPFDWKFYLQISSWGVCLFESYLLYVPFISESLLCLWRLRARRLSCVPTSLGLRRSPLVHTGSASSRSTPKPRLHLHLCHTSSLRRSRRAKSMVVTRPSSHLCPGSSSKPSTRPSFSLVSWHGRGKQVAGLSGNLGTDRSTR